MLSDATERTKSDVGRRKSTADPSSYFFIPGWSPRAYALLGLLPAALILLPRLLFPMQMDQYFHHYLGWRLLHGGLPYVASFDQNFPGGAVLYAIGILLFGQSSLGFAVFDLLVQSLTCYLIVRLALRFDRTGLAAWLGPVIYAFIYIGLGAWDVGQRDSFIAPMLLALLALLTSDTISSSKWFIAGLLSGAMALTRPLFALTVVLIFAAWLWRERKPRKLGIAALGAILLPVLTVLLYVSLGHWQALYDATVAFNLQVYSKFRHGVNLRGSGTMTIVLALGSGMYAVSRPRLRNAALLFGASIIAPLSTWIQGQGDPHHTTPTYAVMSLIAGVGFAWAVDRVRTFRGATRAKLVLMGIVLLILWRGIDRVPLNLIAQMLRGVPLKSLYVQQDRGDVKLEEEFAAADYISTHTKPGDPVYIFSMRIWPYELSDRLPPTRFQSPEHLMMQPADQPLSPVQVAWRREFMSSLERRPPKLILITTTDQMWLYPHAEASIDQVKRFPEFESLLRTDYAMDTAIGAYDVFERR